MSRPSFVLNNVNTDNCPCKKCVPPVRHAGCHGSCTRYIEWDTEHKRKLVENQRQKNINTICQDGAQRRNHSLLQNGARYGRAKRNNGAG